MVTLPQLGLSLAAGSLTTLSPCVFPLLPLVLGGALQNNRFAPLALGLRMAASFAGIGMLVGAAGPALGLDGDHVRVAGAVLLIAFALVMLVPAWSEGGVARGGLILGVFGLGAAIPLVAVAYASRAGFTRARGWVLARINRIKTVFAVVLGLMGLAILTGGDKWLEARVNNLLPDGWLNLTVLF
jgi:cytochrome c biogenesis protein CcdA